jgi:hypothetical protein
MTRTLALVRDYGDLHEALRLRAEVLDVSRLTIDEAAGLPSGYTGKLLCPHPAKGLGRLSLGPLLGALGVMLILVEDPAMVEAVCGLPKRRGHYARFGPAHWRSRSIASMGV